MNDKLSAIAGMIQSPFPNERSNAIAMIERLTGQPFAALITAAVRRLVDVPAHAKLDGIERISGVDHFIAAIDVVLRSAGLEWQDLFKANASLPEARGLEALLRSETPRQAKRVSRFDLPVRAEIHPRLHRTGQGRDGKAYGIFHLTGQLFGNDVRFMGDFIARGDAWIAELLAAQCARRAITVEFYDADLPGKMVTIGKPALPAATNVRNSPAAPVDEMFL